MTTPGNNPSSDAAADRAKANMERRDRQRALAQQEKDMPVDELLNGVPDQKYEEEAVDPGARPTRNVIRGDVTKPEESSE